MLVILKRDADHVKVAMARKLGVRLYWMWRPNWQYSQLVEFGSHAGKPVTATLIRHPDKYWEKRLDGDCEISWSLDSYE
jgi:hypothetical protein